MKYQILGLMILGWASVVCGSEAGKPVPNLQLSRRLPPQEEKFKEELAGVQNSVRDHARIINNISGLENDLNALKALVRLQIGMEAVPAGPDGEFVSFVVRLRKLEEQGNKLRTEVASLEQQNNQVRTALGREMEINANFRRIEVASLEQQNNQVRTALGREMEINANFRRTVSCAAVGLAALVAYLKLVR
jgi:hypothetical protein